MPNVILYYLLNLDYFFFVSKNIHPVIYLKFCSTSQVLIQLNKQLFRVPLIPVLRTFLRSGHNIDYLL